MSVGHVQNVKLNYSTRKELYKEMKLMIEENISVKKKKVTQREFSSKKICMAEKIYVTVIGAKVVYFVDTPTKIERLSLEKYYKLNKRMRQMLYRIGKVKHDEINIMKHLEDLDEKEGKVSLQSYRFMSNWTEKFRNNPYLRKLVTNLIQKVCDKEISSEESLNLVSEMMFLQNVRILQAASYQCEFTSSRMMCIQHFPFKFERIWSQEPQGSIKYQKNVLESKTFEIKNFEYLIIREDFNLIVSIISKLPSFRYLIPPFIKYLQSDHAYDFPLKGLHLISKIFSLSYNPFSDKEHPNEVVNYICLCLLNATISDWDCYCTCQKIGTILNKIRNKIPYVQRAILEELKQIFNDPVTNYDSCLGILVAMRSMEFVSVREILFEVFEKMATFANKNVRYDFYFLLLDVCEIFITKLIESETRLAHQYDFCIASKCLNFFKEDLSLRLTLVLSRYKARMFKEMKYNFKKYHKITMGEGLENPNTFFKNFMENPPKVKDEKVLDYPRSTDYFKCDYSLALYPDEELGGRESEKSGGNDEEESSDDENFRYVEALSDGEGPCTPASYLRRQKRKYFRFLGELPKYCLDHKNLISSYRKKAKDEKPCTGNLSVFV